MRRASALVPAVLLASSSALRRVSSMAQDLSSSAAPSLDALGARVVNSYVRTLRADPEEEQHRPNQSPREVESGHFVRVAPTALRAPYLVAYSRELARELGISERDAEGARFTRLFSGDLGDAPVGFDARGWATPYALSIYGSEMEPNGAGPRGYGYGDGRAISIAEVAPLPGGGGASLELQLKGGGRTPFCRGADGCAVLRSSVREFLASEAMHALGVPTTRTLALVASREEVVLRPWYSNASAGYTRHGGDVMVPNKRAMTVRVARSFLRVGQFELYGRRAARGEARGREELEMLARHALAREYPHLAPPPGAPLQPALLAMLREASGRFAALAAHWLRVGFVQGNFNADNCLVGGVTMDYGPFGFMERFSAHWGMWIGAGDHFAFGNQPAAAERNFGMLAKSLLPLLDDAGAAEAERIVLDHEPRAAEVLAAMWARKLGFPPEAPAAPALRLWGALEGLLSVHPTDYVIFWRQLAHALPAEWGAGGTPREGSPAEARVDAAAGGYGGPGRADAPLADAALAAAALATLEPAFYAPLAAPLAGSWREWLAAWLSALRASGVTVHAAAATMRAANPKYVPREWMLVGAYAAAEAGDAAPLLELHTLFKRPYDDEQPDVLDAERRFYRRAPPGSDRAGGVGFMS